MLYFDLDFVKEFQLPIDKDATFYTKEEFLQELRNISQEANLSFGCDKLVTMWVKKASENKKKLIPLSIYIEVLEEFFPDTRIFLPKRGFPKEIVVQYSTKTGYQSTEGFSYVEDINYLNDQLPHQ